MYVEQQRRADEREERDRAERMAREEWEAARADREARRDEALTAMLMKVVEKLG